MVTLECQCQHRAATSTFATERRQHAGATPKDEPVTALEPPDSEEHSITNDDSHHVSLGIRSKFGGQLRKGGRAIYILHFCSHPCPLHTFIYHIDMRASSNSPSSVVPINPPRCPAAGPRYWSVPCSRSPSRHRPDFLYLLASCGRPRYHGRSTCEC